MSCYISRVIYSFFFSAVRLKIANGLHCSVFHSFGGLSSLWTTSFLSQRTGCARLEATGAFQQSKETIRETKLTHVCPECHHLRMSTKNIYIHQSSQACGAIWRECCTLTNYRHSRTRKGTWRGLLAAACHVFCLSCSLSSLEKLLARLSTVSYIKSISFYLENF